jgi:anaerobic selenocysteine-containing dehydrogenase
MGEIRTTCPYCGVGCGVIARVDENGTLSVKGDPQHPANFGRLCSKGSALAETIDLDGRILHPQIDGQQATWDAALDLGRRQVFANHCRARPGFFGVLCLRSVADRGLLRCQQADEGLRRLGQYRHQFPALHVLLRRRPSPRLRPIPCRDATRISSLPIWSS